MKAIWNFIKSIIIGVWLIFAIAATVCLLAYNEYNVSEFGDYSVLIIDSDDLEPDFQKRDLVIVKRQKEDLYKLDDMAFFYWGNTKLDKYINYGQISRIVNEDNLMNTFYFGDAIVDSKDVVGPANGAMVYHNFGLVLKILESRWGFMFLVMFPTLYAIVYEIYAIVVEAKAVNKEERKQEKKDNE